MLKFKLLILGIVVGTLSIGPLTNLVSADNLGERTVKSLCTTCHRIEGNPISRKNKKAPDLIWAGNKYQPQWLEEWLQDPKQRLYPVGYDFIRNESSLI